MRLRQVSQGMLSELHVAPATVVCASGYEARSTAVAALTASLVAPTTRLIALGFKEHRGTLSRRRNNRMLADHGFQTQIISGEDAGTVYAVMMSLIAGLRRDERMLIDISSMTRVWLGAVLRALVESRGNEGVGVDFCYVPAVFRRPPVRAYPNAVVSPIAGFGGLGRPNRPTALVLGLGYEAERAMGLRELLDPQEMVVLMPRSRHDGEYYAAVLRNNRDVLRSLAPSHVIEYPLDEPLVSLRILQSIALGLTREYRVVLASLGTKLFGLLCLVAGLASPEMSVWRVSNVGNRKPREAQAENAPPIVFGTTWETRDKPSEED